MKRGSRHLGKITGEHSGSQFHLLLLGSLASYGRGGTWRRKWERLKITGGGGQGLHNRPISCSVSGAYALGPDDEEEEEEINRSNSCYKTIVSRMTALNDILAASLVLLNHFISYLWQNILT